MTGENKHLFGRGAKKHAQGDPGGSPRRIHPERAAGVRLDDVAARAGVIPIAAAASIPGSRAFGRSGDERQIMPNRNW